MIEHHNLERAAQWVQQRIVYRRCWELGLDVLRVGVFVALLATLLTALLGWAIPRFVLYGAIAVGAGVIFVLLARRIRIAALDVLIRADRVCGCHAALSTAYEYLQQHTTNPFVPGLASVAEQLAPRIEAHRVFPTRMPRRVWGIPLLLGATLVLFMLKLTPLHFDGDHAPEVARNVSRTGQHLEK